MKVNIMVYDMTGRLQWMSSEDCISDIFKDYIVTWNLENNAGTKLRTGVYLYRAAISTDGSQDNCFVLILKYILHKNSYLCGLCSLSCRFIYHKYSLFYSICCKFFITNDIKLFIYLYLCFDMKI